MNDIRKFFENGLNFQQLDDSKEYGTFFLDSKCYRSKLIPNPRAVGIYNSVDIYNELKSLLYYLVSGHISTVHESYTYRESSFEMEIMIIPGKVNSKFKKLITFRVEPRGDVLDFEEINLAQFDPHKFRFFVPIVIYIDARGVYEWTDTEEESEDEFENESEDESITLKAYKTDKWVVCLMNEPKILFYDCVHYCVCLECEERKPFKKCPYCRTPLLTKVIF